MACLRRSLQIQLHSKLKQSWFGGSMVVVHGLTLPWGSLNEIDPYPIKCWKVLITEIRSLTFAKYHYYYQLLDFLNKVPFYC